MPTRQGWSLVPRAAALAIALLAVGLAASAQVRVRGAVVNRDGVPQRGCLVEFFVNQNDQRPAASAYTDDSGMFYLSDPPSGRFSVRISLGGRSGWTSATVSRSAIDPTPLVVGW
jgi:hypothetical protein